MADFNCIDVSAWQGSIDFNKVKADGIQYVILRAVTKNQKTDKCFETNYKNAKAAGLKIGAYVYSYATNADIAKKEAVAMVNVLKGKALDLPVWYDMEDEATMGRLTNSARTELVNVFAKHVHAAGFKAGIYCNENWYKNKLDTVALGDYPYWVAKYGKNDGVPHTKPAVDKSHLVAWQFSSTGKISGINGNVDVSIYYDGVEAKPIMQSASLSGGHNIKVYSPSTVIAVAEAELGYLEKKNGDIKYLYNKTANAGDANYTKYGYEMHKLYPSVMDYPAAWCDCFVDWCFQKAYGVSTAKSLLGGDFNDYTVASADMYKKKGGWYKTPQVGDQIFFKNSTRICHTGLVVAVDVKKRIVYTIEGNTSSERGVVANGGCVRKKSYSFDYSAIAGYGRPKYTAPAINITSVNNSTSAKPASKPITDSNIQKIQRHLNMMYTTHIAVDGIAGKETMKAIIKGLQVELNHFVSPMLAVDGIAGTKTKAAFKWNAAMLRRGSKGNLVYLMQALLYIRGYDPDGVDGELGAKTEAAVKAFQKAHRLEVDGICGYNTWNKLI